MMEVIWYVDGNFVALFEVIWAIRLLFKSTIQENNILMFAVETINV